MTSLIHPCQEGALIPLKFEVVFNYDFFQDGTKLPAWPKISPIDGNQYKQSCIINPLIII